MSAEIYKQIAAYQNGDSDAALALVEKFKPLIKRYAFFLHREDSFEDLQCFFALDVENMGHEPLVFDG